MSQEDSHTHILVDQDDGFFIVVKNETNVIDWTKVVKNIIKGEEAS